MAGSYVNKSVSFNPENEQHMKALQWAESQGFSGYVRELIIQAYQKEKEDKE